MSKGTYFLERQFEIARETLNDDSIMLDTFREMHSLLEMFFNYLEGKKPMDKQINKVKKAVVKGDKPEAKKDIAKLLKMDKKQDKKLAKCAKKPMKKAK